MGQVKDLQAVGIAHLVLEGNPQEVKISNRILGFQGKKRQIMLSHNSVHVCPGRINPLTVDVRTPVKHFI